MKLWIWMSVAAMGFFGLRTGAQATPEPDAEQVILEDGIRLGDLDSMVLMGDRLMRGLNEAPQPAAALDLWAKAALKNHPGALVRIARELESGTHLPRDRKQAMILWMRAEQAGSPEARLRVAEARLSGEGLKKDEPLGTRLLIQAAEQGNPEAQHRLAACLEQGAHMPRDPRRALEMYRRAASAGCLAAQNDLGVFLALRNDGDSRQEAWAWFRLAADRGHARAAENLAAIEPRLGFWERRAARSLYRDLAERIPAP